MVREIMRPELEHRKSISHISTFLLKIASRCNLNCSYCYVYNKGDSSWKLRPALMSDTIFQAALNRIRRHCSMVDQKEVMLAFHGGEPTLVGPRCLDAWCIQAWEVLRPVADVKFAIQTNGTLLTPAWVEVLARHHIEIGLSVDGLPEVHDKYRVDRKGRGSYHALEQGISLLHEWAVPFGVICVIPFGADPIATHRHLVALGCNRISYVFPDFTHDTIGPIRSLYGPTPCADFLIPILDEWFAVGSMDVRIKELWGIARLVLGGASQLDCIGNGRYGYIFVETGGDIEGLDHLRICDDQRYVSRRSVLESDFLDVLSDDFFHTQLLEGSVPIPTACRLCPEHDTCAGGYVPHRYSRQRQFDNASVWCADLLRVFNYVRDRLGISPEQTRLLRSQLAGNAARDVLVPSSAGEDLHGTGQKGGPP